MGNKITEEARPFLSSEKLLPINFSWFACCGTNLHSFSQLVFPTKSFSSATRQNSLISFINFSYVDNKRWKCARGKECLHHFTYVQCIRNFSTSQFKWMRIQRTLLMFCFPDRRHVWNYWFLTYSCVFSPLNASHPPFTYLPLFSVSKAYMPLFSLCAYKQNTHMVCLKWREVNL